MVGNTFSTWSRAVLVPPLPLLRRAPCLFPGLWVDLVGALGSPPLPSFLFPPPFLTGVARSLQLRLNFALARASYSALLARLPGPRTAGFFVHQCVFFHHPDIMHLEESRVGHGPVTATYLFRTGYVSR